MNRLYYYRNYVLFVLVAIMLTLGLVKVVVQEQLSVLGGNVYQLESDLQKVKAENILLKERILEAKSLRVLDEKAKKDGFVEKDSNTIIYL